MKVYISGAITGTKDYMERFKKAEKKLIKQGYTVVNPAKVSSMLPEDTTYAEYMKMSFCMMDMCQGVYFLKNWEKSLGANKEYAYALQRGMQLMFE